MSYLLAVLLFVALQTSANAATIGYTFATVDIPLANGKTTFPEDINDQGALVANSWPDTAAILATPVTVKRVRTYRQTPFDCNNEPSAETSAFSINNTAQTGGYCAGVSSNPTKLYGFIRAKSGNQTLIDFPGSDGTAVFGLNDRGHATGQFYGPLDQPTRGSMAYRFHCFTFIGGKYKQIDFPRANTYVSCNAIDNRGRVLGEYITVDDFNNYQENGWFIYDNGNFQTDFPLNLAHVGGPAIYLVDMNNDGMILGQRSDGSVFLLDDGIFYGVEFPAEYKFPDVRGLNNKGQFVGLYYKEIGVDPYGYPRHEVRGFVATPSR